jgi:DNA-binding response OmpR family regulator
MSPRPRILVAEDDYSIRDLIRARLDLAGLDVQLARTGAEALDRAHAQRPDGIILDINMPELDGFGVLEALPARADGSRIPVLVLTARHATDDVRRAVRLGAKDYLTKPFSENQLLARVTRLLRPPLPPPPDGAVLL